MLIITAPEQGRIKIGDDIEVVYIGRHGKQARIGVEAPKNVVVKLKEAKGSEDGNNNKV